MISGVTATLVTKMWPILLALGGICPGHGHQPFRENEGHRPDKNSRQNVREVVVAAINCGHAHRNEARKKNPEQLTAVAPSSEQPRPSRLRTLGCSRAIRRLLQRNDITPTYA